MIYSKNLFLLNILRTNGQILTKLYITIYTDKIYLGIVSCHFSQLVRELWPFIDVRIMLPFNMLRHSGLLLHARHCSWAIVRFSDNSIFMKLKCRQLQSNLPNLKKQQQPNGILLRVYILRIFKKMHFSKFFEIFEIHQAKIVTSALFN